MVIGIYEMLSNHSPHIFNALIFISYKAVVFIEVFLPNLINFLLPFINKPALLVIIRFLIQIALDLACN